MHEQPLQRFFKSLRERPVFAWERFQMRDVLVIDHPLCQAVFSRQGAQLLHFQPTGQKPWLWCAAKWPQVGAIRGGVPVCWPQFNRRGPLPKHGFARLSRWRVQSQQADCAVLQLALDDVPAQLLHDAQGQTVWHHPFALELEVQLLPGALALTLQARNTGDQPFRFTTALHSYLAVDDIAALRIRGADGLRYWDAVAGADPEFLQQQGDITFSGETDRVYPRLPQVQLIEPGRQLWLEQPDSMQQSVVWNPGAALCATLADLPANDYRHFVCVEAAQIDDEVELQPGAVWRGGQRLRLA